MRTLLLLLILVAAVTGQNYYADLSVDINADGSATFSGITNHPQLTGTTSEFTSKKGEYWIFNLSVPETFDTSVIKVNLPADAVMNYVQGKGIAISSEKGISITQVSEGPLAFAVQYKIGPTKDDWMITVLASVATIFVFWLIFTLAHRAGKKRAKKALPEYIKGLPPRQREILQLVRDAGGRLTQKQIEERMSIPKSSISRNIDGLVRKGIIEKQSLGLSNIIKLK